MDLKTIKEHRRPFEGQLSIMDIDWLVSEVERLEALIHNPHTDEFFSAVSLEAAHQQERWGTAHDEGKGPQAWFWLLGYLAGKSIAAFALGDVEKGKHHIISSAASLLNWFRYATGEMKGMRPSAENPEGGKHDGIS